MTKWTNELSMHENVPNPPATNFKATQQDIGIIPFKLFLLKYFLIE